MANEPSKESSPFPSSDREDSGLQDILSVTKKLKNTDDDASPDDDDASVNPADSGLILFSAGSDSPRADEDDDGMFGSFSGGLGAGFGAAVDLAPGLAPGLATGQASTSAADLIPLAGEGRVTETRPAEVVAKPAPADSKRSPFVAIAVVLGLALLGGAAVMMTDNSGEPKPEPVAQAGMSAPEDDAAVGKAEEPVAPEPAGASAGAVPTPEPEVVAETEGAPLEGETEGLGALDPDAGDPMGMRDGLLENDGTNGVAKGGKWDQGTSYAKTAPKTDEGGEPEPEPEPEPDLLIDKKPTPKPAGGGTSDEEVDCLLNPDMPKCAEGATTKPKSTEVLTTKIPEKLSTTQLKEGFSGIKTSAKKCGGQHGAAPGTSVKVHVSIEGATGKVTEVRAIGEHAGTPLGSCVEDAVKQAQFQVFKNPSQGADYPLVM
jgi:hypothetical protein